MEIKTEPYLISLGLLPTTGQHILAHQDEDNLVVYQAYNRQIAEFAIANQFLGGSSYSYSRMSWIKPNFLWMMYRCGWAQKENQERVLAIWIRNQDFDAILSQAVFSSYKEIQDTSHDDWRRELENKEVRLQWDPDHDPYGNKVQRRAIQLGLKGKVLEEFGKKSIIQIQDITDFVVEQRAYIEKKDLSKLLVPIERVYQPKDQIIKKKIALSEM